MQRQGQGSVGCRMKGVALVVRILGIQGWSVGSEFLGSWTECLGVCVRLHFRVCERECVCVREKEVVCERE